MKVESLRPYQKKVNLTVKVLDKNEPREVTSKLDDSKHTVTEALVGDDTATVLLTLWDDDIEKIEVGKTYDVINGFTSLFKNSLRLNIGRYGEYKESSEEITEVNEEKPLSESSEEKSEEKTEKKTEKKTAEAVEEALEEEKETKETEEQEKETKKEKPKEEKAKEEETDESKEEEESKEETSEGEEEKEKE